ncbi:unnamed protein product [Penicillium salamii]|uniref:Ankyrin repeat-containing domain-containing protein n=1 Tax=Penicillium salamii TaxID=1612424 RepID=A0A9W4IMM9_9EURO|nr:unnamed protein product [Penicillium salamii]CAG7959600.1 unnamed protein product [Penicillium salamii]CAG7998459.1 unnamed protein product [Penicillium salamii]CAG8014869.1 unnamed protein product [Penicillium salamii]CAG8283960.1 unnamed protein product [Penicillium salamii]
MSNIRDLPNELLLWIVSHLEDSSPASGDNIKFQNSNLLHLAVKDDNVDLAAALLQHNADIKAFFRGKTPLMRSFQYASAAMRELLLNRQELEINIQNQARETALWYAVHYGNYSMVKRLLAQPKVRVDIKHKHGRTALHLAVFAGRIEFIHLLLSRGSNPDQQDDSGDSPWAWARHFNRPVMKMILSNDPDSYLLLGTQSSRDAELQLHQAVAHGSVAAVQRLRRRKDLALDTLDRNGYTPIHLAVESNRPEVVDLLLSHPRANVNCTDKDGNTPLWLSTYSSYYEITERLLAEKDIDVNLIGGRGRFEMPSTSLHHAATRSDTVLLRRLLAVPEIDPNVCVAGHSPISIAASRGCVSTVACLLNMGNVEINGRGSIDPPLCRAAAHGHHDVVRLLVQQGTRLNINESTIADTALCIAARNGDLEMVQTLLLHNKIDVNLRNEYFEDPLMLAVNNCHFSIVRALLANTRLKRFSLKRSLELARDACIQRAIQNRMEADNSRQRLLRRSPKMQFGGLYS